MPTEILKDAALTQQIIAAFYAVYDKLGYGFLESVFRSAFAIELRRRSLPFTREEPAEVFYDAICVGHYRTDFIVDGRVLVEIKASRVLSEADHKQLLNYLRATRLEIGLMLHFGPKPGFHRYVFENDNKRALTVHVNS